MNMVNSVVDNELRKIIEINASPEEVFLALTKNEELTQWFPDKAIFEPKVGGKMHFTFFASTCNKDSDAILDGEILEFVPNKKLVYTFIPNSESAPDGVVSQSTVVTWNLEQIGKNKTKVTLIHSGFTKDMDNLFKEVTSGWNFFTGRLVQYFERKSQ